MLFEIPEGILYRVVFTVLFATIIALYHTYSVNLIVAAVLLTFPIPFAAPIVASVSGLLRDRFGNSRRIAEAVPNLRRSGAQQILSNGAESQLLPVCVNGFNKP